MSIPDSRLLTTAEVARLCGVNVRTVHRWVDRDLLKPIAKGSGIRGPMFFAEEDVTQLAVAS